MFSAPSPSSWLSDRKIGWALACGLMMLALLAPAIWNGFPIVFYDTGGYFARPFEGTLHMGRSVLYGAFLALGMWHDFWPSIIIQSALVIWLVVLTLRVHGFGGRPWLAAAIVVGLCLFTGLPWYAAQLMPDILLPACVVGVALLAFQAGKLRRWEITLLVVAIAVAIASHMSILALALGLLASLAVLRAASAWIPLQQPIVLLPAAAVLAGVLLAPLSNYVVTQQVAFTPGGFNFVFGRLVQDGIADRYLADHCPDPTLRLCAYRAEMPQTANDWLWAEESPIYVLGGFDEFEPEAKRIVIESLTLYPVLHVKTAIGNTLKQFAALGTGDGLTPWSWYTRLTFEQYAPEALQSYIVARQATSSFDFTLVNLIHIPLQALAIAMLPFIIITRPPGKIAEFTAVMLLALLGNAAICGMLSSPSDRYQSRLAWLAVLVASMAVLSWQAARRDRRDRIGATKTDSSDVPSTAAAREVEPA